MEAKKSNSADIHSKRPLIFSFSLVISLLLVITVFEWNWSQPIKSNNNLTALEYTTEKLIEVPPTMQPPIPIPQKLQSIVKPTLLLEITELEETSESTESIINQEIQVTSSNSTIVIHNTDEAEVADQIFLVVESPAEFPGGQTALLRFIKSNLNYPKSARRKGIEGWVYVQAIVEKDGSLSNIHLVKGIDPSCDEEALRVINLSPKWTPGKQRGRPVRVQVVIPIVYMLRQ